MGQKTNPKIFRAITTQQHFSNWYCNNQKYSDFTKNDFLIRLQINKNFNNILSLSNIIINRSFYAKNRSYTNIILYALIPQRNTKILNQIYIYLHLIETKKILGKKKNKLIYEVVENDKKELYIKKNLLKITVKFLKEKIRQTLKLLQKINPMYYDIKILFYKNNFTDAILIAKYIMEQITKKTMFRRIMEEAIKLTKKSNLIQGIKIKIAGRLNGIEIARSECIQEGKIPLHTLKVKIDYTHQKIKTIYGILGIKVWLSFK